MKHHIFIIALAVTVMASSCSILNSGKSKAIRATEADAAAGAVSGAGISDDKLSGEWTIMQVNGNNLPQEDQMPYLTFEPAQHRFYASNGCNSINGDYKVSGGKLQFSSVLSTMRYCPDVPYESEISAMLGGSLTPEVNIRRSGSDHWLTLSAGGITVAAVQRNMAFLNGQWIITQAKGESIDDDEANLFIDINELKVHGNTGCNYFNGTLYLDPAKSGSVEFGGMGLTRMACPKGNQEHNIMLALEQTVTARQSGDGRVTLLDAAGTTVMQLRKASVAAE